MNVLFTEDKIEIWTSYKLTVITFLLGISVYKKQFPVTGACANKTEML